jgi:hypothetical protein
MSPHFHTLTNQVIEFSFQAGKVYSDPFNQVELDVVFSTPTGERKVLPAYWAGDQEWRVRFSSAAPGKFHYTTKCSDTGDPGLNNQEGQIEISQNQSDNPLTKHGRLRVRDDRNGFEHLDGTPFFWLGDTWWMAFTGRLGYPEEFYRLLDDRIQKGFTLVHMVAGLFPDMPPYDPRGANQAGFSWEENFSRINPAFFDLADLKLQTLVSRGIVPLVVGAWGYYLPVMGVEKMKKHYRYLVARWAAYPVLWCLAGEVTMPWYLSTTKENDEKVQKKDWAEVGLYLQEIDAFDNPITAHSGSTGESPTELADASFLDFNFVQAGHGNYSVALNATKHMLGVMDRTTLKPVINAETCYEGILGSAHQDVQRYLFWSNLLSGIIGYSYGANGIWQLNRADMPYGPSPHGMSWGGLPWDEAMHLPGSTQLSLGKRMLERYRFWLFLPHPEWITPHASKEDTSQPFAAGIPGEVRVFYFPNVIGPWMKDLPQVHGLEANTLYQAYYFNPINGEEQTIGQVTADKNGDWTIVFPTAGQDNVLVLETAQARV